MSKPPIMYSSFPLVLLLISLPRLLSLSIRSPSANKQAPNTMLPSETETLYNIMESMSSDRNWRISHPIPCQPNSSWPGLKCKLANDNYVHVSRLDFGSPPYPSCKLNATFPQQIFDLPYIQSIFFLRCFNSSRETTFDISPNRLMNSSLQHISLRSNSALVGPIPLQISYLKSLQILALSQNRLSETLPVEIFSLRSLVHLDLSYNMLIGPIPYQLGHLNNLIELDLSYNLLSGSIPGTIGQLGLLQKLDLSSNSLTGSVPDSIEKLHLLDFLALSYNQLQGTLPKGLQKLQSLQYFIMDNNPMFTPLPPELGKLVKLQELRLANSGYSGTIPPAFSQLKILNTLSLQDNKLMGEIPAGFGSLSHIYHLNLSMNSLSGVVPFSSSFINRLGRNLDLIGNTNLCLNSSETYDVKIGVGVCRSKNGSMIQPLNNSHAPCWFSESLFQFNVLRSLILHLVFSLI